jgi:hypothetical protein
MKFIPNKMVVMSSKSISRMRQKRQMAASYRAIRLSPRPTDATPSEFVDDAAENEVIVDGASHEVNNSISDDTASLENMEVQVPIVKKQLLLMDNEHINGIKEVFKDVDI